MRRVLLICLVLLATLPLIGSAQSRLAPVVPSTITVTVKPVALMADNPDANRIGELRFLGGWSLTAGNRWFGGISGLAAKGSNLTAISDAGALISFRVGRFGRVSDALVAPLPAGCGPYPRKTDRDSEALAYDRASDRLWIGFESRNAICRIEPNAQAQVMMPAAMRGWPRTGGAEAMTRLADGRFLVFAERRRGGGPTAPLLVFPGDPVDGAAPVMMSYRPPEGFKPTDVAELPDGRLVILNRRFEIASMFSALVTIVEPFPAIGGATVSGRVVARFAPPFIAENLEAVAVTEEDGRPILWIMSDDNYMPTQRTLLLKFTWEPERASLRLD